MLNKIAEALVEFFGSLLGVRSVINRPLRRAMDEGANGKCPNVVRTKSTERGAGRVDYARINSVNEGDIERWKAADGFGTDIEHLDADEEC